MVRSAFPNSFHVSHQEKIRERRDDLQIRALWSLFVEKESLSPGRLQVPGAVDLLGLCHYSRVCSIHWTAWTHYLLTTLPEAFISFNYFILLLFFNFFISFHFISFLMLTNAKSQPEYGGKMLIQFQVVFNILFGIS